LSVYTRLWHAGETHVWQIRWTDRPQNQIYEARPWLRNWLSYHWTQQTTTEQSQNSHSRGQKALV
jgi:hypothetical protein